MFKPETDILDKRFKVLNQIGAGAFGEIYRVEKRLTKQVYAMKVERATKDQNSKQIMLFWESKMIRALKGKTNEIPNLHFVGQERDSNGKVYHIMIMDLLGCNLGKIFEMCDK